MSTTSGNPAMSSKDALQILANATAALQTTRQQHDLILQAIRVLGDELSNEN